VTTTIMQLVTCGVGAPDEDGNRTWAGAVKYMVKGAQSCACAFPLCNWFGKDDAVNCREHVVPWMEAAMVGQ